MDQPALAEWDTQLPADSVEAYPPDRSRFVCSTYRIEGPARRVGRLHWLAVADAEASQLVAHDAVDGPGVFDAKWVLVGEEWLLSVAASDGGLHFYAVPDAQKLQAAPALMCRPDLENGAMALSVGWATGPATAGHPRAVLSYSSGHLVLAQWAEGAGRVTAQWSAHGLEGFGQEVWCAAFDAQDDSTAYSGADDCLLKRWDVRCATATAVVRHDMGVTCLAPHPSRPHLLAYGSYDERLRVVDVRSLRRELSSFRTEGGGVWRAKWHPSAADRFCVAAMHAGAVVLRLDGEFINTEHPPPSEAAAHDGVTAVGWHRHGSLAYGIDWLAAPGGAGDLLGSCSFYDARLHLWRAPTAPGGGSVPCA